MSLRLLGTLCLLTHLGAFGLNVNADPSPVPQASRPAIHGILYNDDDSHRFGLDPPGAMKPERLDMLVDELADSQVTVMLINCNAQRTNYQSKVWDVYDMDNVRAMFAAGVDPNQRMIDRCRKRGISPWISIRMNDVHDAHKPNPSFHSRFWMEHHEYWRYPDRTGWEDRALNYGLKPVRDYMMLLIREVCDRYDMDGLELDWNRFRLHFREGEEIEQGKALTEWMVEVREVVRAAEKKWKHPILLVPRVPARPDVSYGIGLDAITWAKRGLIDHLIVAPFFGTTDYDIPVEQWIELLRGTGVGVTAGLEIRVQPHPSAPVLPNTPERRRGAAMAALARGSQGIYLFNHYDIGGTMPFLLNEMHSVDSLVNKDRIYTVTYADIAIPGKPIPAALPKSLKSGESAEFRLFIGPKPLTTAKAEVQLILKPEKEGEKCTAQVMLNGHPPTANAGYVFNADAFQEGYNVVRVVNAGTLAATVESVELALRFPPSEKNGVGSPVPGLPATPEVLKKSQPAPQDNPPAKQSLRALHKADRVIAISGQGYFPVMIKLSDGSLGAVIRGGAGHLGIGGRLDFIRSADGGRTWSKPIVAVDSPSDDRNPAFGQMPDGTLVLAYAELHGYRPDGTFDWNAGPCLPFYVTSSDGGKTWSAKRSSYNAVAQRVALRQDYGLQGWHGVAEPLPDPEQWGCHSPLEGQWEDVGGCKQLARQRRNASN